MYNKEMIKDFINYGIIAIFFLIQKFTIFKFILLITMLIFDLISLYIIEKKEFKNTYDFEDDYRYDHWEG